VIRSHSEKSYRNLRKPDVLAINIFCGSACTILTSHIANHRNPKALEFYVQATSGFYIHRPYKLIENGKLVDLTKKKNKDRVFNEMIESYRSAGASPQWLNEISKSIKQSENGVVFKAKALCISQSQIIPRDSCSRWSSNEFIDYINKSLERDQVLGDDPRWLASIFKYK